MTGHLDLKRGFIFDMKSYYIAPYDMVKQGRPKQGKKCNV